MTTIAHARYGLSIVVVAIIAMAMCWVADRHNRVFDISRAASNSLDPKSIAVLELLGDDITVAAFIPQGHPARDRVAEFFSRYQRHKPGLKLAFVDPRHDLSQAREFAANLGEIVFVHDGGREVVTRVTENEVTNALARLARGAERYITFLSRNGERQVARQANHDVSEFAAYLEKRGLKVREYAFGSSVDIPANTAVLVIASPAVAYAPGELEVIYRYVAAGGNLLWLSEPDQPPELTGLASALGVRHLSGTVVDGVGWLKYKQPTYAVADDYAAHAAFEGFKQTAVFPYAAALLAQANIDWRATILARTSGEAWTETGALEGNVGFDDADEIQGALILAVALTKQHAEHEQRVVVVGDGDFISNTFVDNLGNREFARRLVEWLAADDALIDIEVAEVADRSLELEMWQRLTIFVVFGLGIPLSLTANGMLHWWRRRRA